MNIVKRLLDPTPLTDEELDEQVKACLIETGTLINFHHPFIVGMYFHDIEDSIATDRDFDEFRNHLLVRPKIKLKHEYIHEGGRALSAQLIMFERPYRGEVAEALLVDQGLGQHLGTEKLQKELLWLWTDTEFPSRSAVWGRIFDALREHLQPPFGDLSLLEPDGDTTVYRGISGDWDDGPEDNGLSWTTSRDTAAWFARRFCEEGQSPIVLTGMVAREDVWFATNNRGEHEVVSDAVRIIAIEEAI